MDALSPQNKLPKRQFDESKQGIKEQSIEDDDHLKQILLE